MPNKHVFLSWKSHNFSVFTLKPLQLPAQTQILRQSTAKGAFSRERLPNKIRRVSLLIVQEVMGPHQIIYRWWMILKGRRQGRFIHKDTCNSKIPTLEMGLSLVVSKWWEALQEIWTRQTSSPTLKCPAAQRTTPASRPTLRSKTSRTPSWTLSQMSLLSSIDNMAQFWAKIPQVTCLSHLWTPTQLSLSISKVNIQLQSMLK